MHIVRPEQFNLLYSPQLKSNPLTAAYAWCISSAQSAIRSREINEYFIPSEPYQRRETGRKQTRKRGYNFWHTTVQQSAERVQYVNTKYSTRKPFLWTKLTAHVRCLRIRVLTTPERAELSTPLFSSLPSTQLACIFSRQRI